MGRNRETAIRGDLDINRLYSKDEATREALVTVVEDFSS